METEETHAVVCDKCGKLISAADRKCRYCGASRIGGGAGLKVRSWLRGRSITKMLLGANLLLYVLGIALSGSAAFEGGGFGFLSASRIINYEMGALIPEAVTDLNEYWRLLTCTFLHWGLIHIIFNMMSLWSLGQFIESEFGPSRFSIIYVGAGIAGSVVSVLLPSQALTAGASGAICGLLGAGLALGFRAGGLWGQFIRQQFMQNVISMIIISMLPGISWQGHFGGFVGGFVLAWFLAPQIRRSASTTAEAPIISLFGGVMLALVPLCFGIVLIQNAMNGEWLAELEKGARSTPTVHNAKRAKYSIAAIGAPGWAVLVPKAVENMRGPEDGRVIFYYKGGLALKLDISKLPEIGIQKAFADSLAGMRVLEPPKLSKDGDAVDLAYHDSSASVTSRVHAHDLGDGRMLTIEWALKHKDSEEPPDAELMTEIVESLQKD